MPQNNLWNKKQLESGLQRPVEVGGATGFVIDSRQVAGGEIFLPLVGGKQDGHDYIEQVIEQGAAGSLCLRDRVKNYSVAIKQKLIASDDIMADIKKLAGYRRDEIHNNGGKVLAITGSVGKTSVKEMVAHVLNHSGKEYYKSPANQNNTLGVPLCLLNTPATIQAGVYECGMNHKGELLAIGKTLRPDIVIITNIRENHIGYLGSLQGIAAAKGELLEHMMGHPPIAILEKISGQYDFFDFLSREFKNHHPRGKVVSVGEGDYCNVRLKATASEAMGDAEYNFKVSAEGFGRELNYHLKTHGRHQALNSLFALAGLYELGVEAVFAAQQLLTYGEPSGRGNSDNLVIGNKKIILIDESYNAAPASMKASLEIFAIYIEKGFDATPNPTPNHCKRIAILGDMKELGDDEIKYHQEVIEFAFSRHAITNIILVGTLMKQAYTHRYGNGAKNEKIIALVDNADQAIAVLDEILTNGAMVMVKASNSMGLVKIVKHLQEKSNKK